jgi:hypothetical protein
MTWERSHNKEPTYIFRYLLEMIFAGQDGCAPVSDMPGLSAATIDASVFMTGLRFPEIGQVHTNAQWDFTSV